MKAFAHVLTEEFVGQWFAWFYTKPNATSLGSSREEAVERLFELYGENEFDIGGMIQLVEPSSCGHEQVLVPHRRRVLLPPISRN